MRVTLSDIAQKLGVSKSTVSIALRNDRRLPVATRERIQRVAGELGYRPDPSLSAIAAQRWRSTGQDHGIGVALLDNKKEPARQVRSAYLKFARLHLDKLGYHATVFDLDAQPSVAATNRILIARGIRGVLIPPVYDESLLSELELPRFALAAAGLARWVPPFSAATQDAFENVSLGLRRIVELGYRRIGVALLRHDGNVPDDAHRLGAAMHARERYREAGISIHIWEGRIDSIASEVKPFLDWYHAKQPQALLGFNEFAYDWLRRAALKPPGYASLTRFDQAGKLAGLDPQHQRIAEAAAELLDQEIRHHRLGVTAETPNRLLIPPKWIDAPSLPPAAAAKARTRG